MTSSLRTPAVDASLDERRSGSTPRQTTIIRPPGRWPGIGLREIWAYRDLAFYLVWRDFKVRYAQTVLGYVWAVLQPLLNTFIFTVIFGMFAKLPSDGVPYPLFALAAQVPWTFFTNAFSAASNSLVQNSQLLTKVYFPRLVIPVASVMTGVVDFVITLALLLLAMLYYGRVPHAGVLLMIPVSFLVMSFIALGIGCWLAALNIKYRDVKYVTPVLLQLWQYASPVAYALSLVPARYRTLYALNPMVGVIEGFRSSILGTSGVDERSILLSLTIGAVVFAAGIAYFRRMEHSFADLA